jgi:hypothetical protein
VIEHLLVLDHSGLSKNYTLKYLEDEFMILEVSAEHNNYISYVQNNNLEE